MTKKLLILFLVFVCFACSNDDGGGTDPNLEAALGTWNLSELQISPEQDIDEDGTPTNNVLSELSCISGTIRLNTDFSWTFTGTDVVVTTITGGLFKFFCAQSPRNASGVWDINGNTIRLSDGSGITTFILDVNAMTLTNIIGETLPGLQAEVYTKQ